VNVFGFIALGIETTVIGMGVVFIVLILLSFCIKGLNFLDDFFAAKTIDTQAEIPPAEAIVRHEGSDAIPLVERKNRNDTAISPAVVAAIMCAVCMMTGSSAGSLKFTSIKRAGSGQSLWTAMGTNEIIVTRQRFLERGI
jgi:Na+-transporting methylmalonyl-CoA/oxaloacetate decarboxylase gamma subunit